MTHARHFILNKLKKEPYSCTRCFRDKNDTKKVSLENSLLPSHVPLELQNFTQMEEMFIASVLCYEPTLYTKPEGQRAYRSRPLHQVYPRSLTAFFILFLDIQKNYKLLYLPLIVVPICQNI